MLTTSARTYPSVAATGGAVLKRARVVARIPASDLERARAFYARHGFRPDGTRLVDSWTGLPEVRLVR